MKKVYLMGMVLGVMVAIAACAGGKVLARKLQDLPGKAVTLAEIKKRGITLDAMEKLYPSGLLLYGDSVPSGYMQAWSGFFKGLAGEMRKSGMDWSVPYRLSGRAYFAPDGTVDHYFYAWTGKEETQPPEEWQERFGKVLEQYLDTFCFAYPLQRRFAQCGGVTFQPAR